MKRLFTLVFLFSVFNSAAEQEIPETRRFEGDGTEIIMRGLILKEDPVWGHVPVPNSFHEYKKIKDGVVLTKTRATVDENGFRVSSASHRPGKKKHLLLMDSSTVFGEGLDDEETMAHVINSRSNIYEAYPIAFYGYGPQHMWLRFKEGKLPQQIKEKTGSAIILTYGTDIQRIFGTLEVFGYASRFPQLKETSPGVFSLNGRFDTDGKWWQRFLAAYCVPYAFCASKLNYFGTETTQEQIETASRLFKDIINMYRSQFNVENVTFVWRGREKNRKIFESLTDIKVIQQLQVPDTYDDGHLTPASMKALADSFFDAGLVK